MRPTAWDFDLQLFGGSGAGLNRVFATVLSINNTGTATVGSPLTAYGTIGLNDSGMVLNEAMNFTKWTFSITGTATGYGFTCYGTVDPKAYATFRYNLNPSSAVYPAGAITLPATSWFVLPGPSEQAGTGVIANPMTATNPLFICSMPLLAVRVVLTANSGSTGPCAVQVEAVP